MKSPEHKAKMRRKEMEREIRYRQFRYMEEVVEPRLHEIVREVREEFDNDIG